MGLCISISTSKDKEDRLEYAQPRQVNFNMDSELQYEEKQSTTYNKVDEFLRLHYKYGNLSFKRLRCMEKLGIIPKNFEKCDTPICAACMYAKSTQHKPLQVTKPG